MKSHIEIGGTTPADEECASVGDEGYAFRARREAKVFINQIIRQFGEKLQKLIDDGRIELVIHSNRHDFGSYYDVIAKFEENDEIATNYAYEIESDVATEWDDISRAELGLPIVKEEAVKEKEIKSNIEKVREFVESLNDYTLYSVDEDGSVEFISSDASGWKKNPTHFSVNLLAFGDYHGDLVNKSNIEAMEEIYKKEGLETHTHNEAYNTETFLIGFTDLENETIKEAIEGLKNYPLIDEDKYSQMEYDIKSELLNEFWEKHQEELLHMGKEKESFFEKYYDDIILETGATPYSKKLNELEDVVGKVDLDVPYKKAKKGAGKPKLVNPTHVDELINFIEKNKNKFFDGTIMDIKDAPRKGYKEVWVELHQTLPELSSKITNGKFVVGEMRESQIPMDKEGFRLDSGDDVKVKLYMSLGGVLIETLKVLNKK